jgi:hypothetical protein
MGGKAKEKLLTDYSEELHYRTLMGVFQSVKADQELKVRSVT